MMMIDDDDDGDDDSPGRLLLVHVKTEDIAAQFPLLDPSNIYLYL